ncbi:hypothetical protein BDQ17DRAFT_1081801 [Cyathus striatus]|nr:hypothetical protein BDQ17DRAFT_1081801 [Cyathus striatus]
MLSLKLNSAFFFFALVLRSCALHVPTVHDAQAIFQPSSSSSSQDVLYGAADGVEKYPIKIYKPPRGTLRKFVIGNEGEREGIMRVASEYNLDIWHHTSTEVHIYTPEDEPIPSELRFFEHNQMKISSPSPSASSKSGAPVNWNLASFTNSTFHDMYHPLFEIDEFILQLQELFPEKVRVREIGHSAEGREMRAISVSSTPIEELGGEEEEDNEWDIVEVEDASEDSKDLKKDKKEKSKKDKKKNKKKGKKGKGRKNPPPAEKSKLGFVIVGAQHAREVRCLF